MAAKPDPVGSPFPSNRMAENEISGAAINAKTLRTTVNLFFVAFITCSFCEFS